MGLSNKENADVRDLLSAIWANNGDQVRKLIEGGMNPNTSEKDGFTPLHRAGADGHREIVKYLVERGANVNASDKRGFTPLHLAAQQHQPEIVTYLLDNGATLNPQNVHGNTPLHCAAGTRGTRSTDTYRALLGRGADPRLRNRYGSSVLYVASSDESSELRDILAEFGYQCEDE